MSGKGLIVSTLLAVLLAATAVASAGHPQKTDVLQQLLAQRDRVRVPSGDQQPEPQPQPARVERRVQMSGDEREIMTKQIMQAISGKLHGELRKHDPDGAAHPGLAHSIGFGHLGFQLGLGTLSLLCLLY